MKKREVKSQKQEQNGHKKGARNKRGGGDQGPVGGVGVTFTDLA
jgi:hypothetical protein